MKSIKVLGTGCPSCVSAEKVIEEVVNELNIDAKIERVTDIMEIMAFDVMKTPAVVVDGKVMIKGKVPSKDEVKAILVDNFANNACCSDESSNDSCCSTDEKETGCC
ncbi:small redox-active disulfide protein 2 [Lutibacter oricola]|uniref:Small redox-active disulfide protein 2 n=1 Tax=Lutibacter oricola TaxID=762486 RepID=A0A1H2RXS7_9FLAO|nr:thioredoxin family protein [Lutibacter oricola]SDW24273.1 small redox-active disulfide protein 2 [Lutibacter oricola]